MLYQLHVIICISIQVAIWSKQLPQLFRDTQLLLPPGVYFEYLLHLCVFTDDSDSKDWTFTALVVSPNDTPDKSAFFVKMNLKLEGS